MTRVDDIQLAVFANMDKENITVAVRKHWKPSTAVRLAKQELYERLVETINETAESSMGYVNVAEVRRAWPLKAKTLDRRASLSPDYDLVIVQVSVL